MSCPLHPAFDPTCHACLDAAAGQVGKTGHSMANAQVGHLVLATGPVRPGYQHSTATYVEGREAPRLPPPSCAHEWTDRRRRCLHCGAIDFAPPAPDAATVEAPMEACEMPASSGGAAWAATVEACARAAYEASLAAPKRGYHGQAIMELEWSSLGPIRQGHWGAIARAVLAAAKGAGR